MRTDILPYVSFYLGVLRDYLSLAGCIEINEINLWHDLFILVRTVGLTSESTLNTGSGVTFWIKAQMSTLLLAAILHHWSFCNCDEFSPNLHQQRGNENKGQMVSQIE